MAKKLRGWDTYVKEAQKSKKYEPVEFSFKGKTVKVPYPTFGAQKKLQEATFAGDVDGQIKALFGEKLGEEVIKEANELPMGVLDNLVLDVLAAFGLADPRPDDEDEDGDEAGKLSETPSAESATE